MATDAASAYGPTGSDRASRELRALVSCMKEGGWDVSYDPQGGGVQAKTAPGQQRAQSDAMQRCTVEFDKANPVKVLTEADYKDLYRQELKTVDCLSKHGYPQSSTPVSEQQYVADYASGKAPSWYAYQALGDTPSGEMLAKMEKYCPQPTVDR